MLYEIMKKFKFLVGMVAAVMFSLTYTSCDKVEDLVDNSQENVSGDEAFLPKAFADKEVAAWYSWTEKDKDKTKTEAVFLFKDNTFVVTKNKVYSKEDGRSPEREIEAVGQYSLIEGDFTNGKASVVISDGRTMTVVIKDGKLTTEMGDEVFTKQDNAKLPKATDPTGNNNQGGNNNQNNGMEAFLPTTYANKTISGWYSYGGKMSDSGYDIKFVAAIYFFDDNTYVATSNILLSGPNGEYPQRTIVASGSYRIIEGNLNTGKIEITINASTSITVEIENGQLKTIEEGETVIYTKQDNSKLPEPSEPTENGNQGGGNQGGNGDITGNSIYGTWVDDLANPYGTLTLNSNGKGTLWEEDFDFTYQDGILIYDQESKYQITIDGDVMTWAYIDEEYGPMEPQVWYRSNGSFDKKVSTGRWNGLMGEDASDYGIVYFFYENEVEFYIIAWGEQLKGSYTHEGGVINFSLREGYNARTGDAESWSWEAGNLDPETLRLTEGYEWRQMDIEVLSERKQELEKFTFALVSDVKAYGGLFGRSMTIVKAK